MNSPNEQKTSEIKLIHNLHESGLSEHPIIASLLRTAARTGNFSGVNRYLSKRQGLVDMVNRRNALDEELAKKNPFYPYPEGQELEKLSGRIKLGIVNKRNGVIMPFGISPETLTMHASTAGRSGSGKSWAMILILIQLVKLSQALHFNLILPDVKVFYRRVVGKVPGLKIIPFNKFIFNPLEVPEWMDPRDFVVLFAKKFAADNILGIVSEGIIRKALEILFRKKGILEGRKNHANLRELLAVIAALQSSKYYGPHYRDVFDNVDSRLGPYLLREKNFCQRRGISHEVFAKENVILELPLSKVPDAIHNFCVSWIAVLNFVRNMELGLRGNHLRTLYLIDEARTILSATRERSQLEWLEPGLNEVITKGREFGIALWLLSQEMSSFSQVFRSNCFLKICFPLTDGEDVSQIQKSFRLTDQQTDYLFQIPEKRVAICRYGKFERPFLLVIPEVKHFDEVPDDHEVDQAMDDFYRKILPKQESEEIEIAETVTPKFNYTETEADGLIMVKQLAKNPFLNYRELITELHLTPTGGDKARTWMINSGFVKVHSITLRRGKPGEYFELTEEAYREFGGKPPAGKGSFEHKCFCHMVKDSMEEQGFGARVEGSLKGSSKLFDVLAWKEGEGMIGYEVTLTFHNLIENLRADLRTTVKKVIVVCRNKDELQVAKSIVKKELGEVSRVEFKTIFEFTQKNKD